MKRLFQSALLIILLLSAASCIRQEAPNAECDIVGIDSLWLAGLPKGFLNGNPIIKNRSVTFPVSPGSSLSNLNPRFLLTPGATAFYLNDDSIFEPCDTAARHDFSRPRIYKIVSQDKQWSKDYLVSFQAPIPLDSCGFEHFSLDKSKQYYRLLQTQTDGSLNAHIWDSGNAGYALSGQAHAPSDYPTSFTQEGVTGYCAKLQTKSTGYFGKLSGKPIAAGSLFIGEFMASQAVLHPLQATRMGLLIAQGFPSRLSGWYRYRPGKTMTDKNSRILPGEQDECEIYGVLYEADPHRFVPLTGADILSSPRIVATARQENWKPANRWTRFSLPFTLLPGKTFSKARLLSNGYAITVVMTSSKGGATFRGAVGSVLLVDNIKITWQK